MDFVVRRYRACLRVAARCRAPLADFVLRRCRALPRVAARRRVFRAPPRTAFTAPLVDFVVRRRRALPRVATTGQGGSKNARQVGK